MFKVGTNNIGKVFLGNTGISKAYLGIDLVFDGGSTPPTPPLPYDAEVEYLQCSGQQHIDIGLTGNLDTQIEVSFKLSTGNVFICGCRGNNTNDITIYTGSSRFGNISKSTGLTINTNYVVEQLKDFLIVNGTSTANNATASFVTPYNIYLMWASGNTASSQHMQGKVYYFKMWDGSTLVRDMIPVRVGTTGYMYDKVSGQLFGNNGSGNFTLGNDVTT